MTKNQILAEHIVVTFVEAAVAYLSINQTSLHGNWKPVAIGALGAALSAVYNLLRQSPPTITQPSLPVTGATPQIVSPEPTETPPTT